MSIRNRLSRIESRSGDRHRPTVRADPFWRAVRDADAAIESGDLAALVDAANQADSRDIEQRRDKTEMRRAAAALVRLSDGLERLAGDDD